MTLEQSLPPVLEEMLASGVSVTSSGERLSVHSQIGRDHSEALHRIACRFQPSICVEVGMAFGFSTLAMLAGTSGQVVSIDPNQKGDYLDAGVYAVERAGYSTRHRLLREPSYFGLPRLLHEGPRVQLAYIDGWHTFDYVLVDFFYIDKLLDVGGIVVFNDCYLEAVNRVIRFLRTHRSYQEIDAGLSKAYSPQRNPLHSVALRLRDHQAQDRYFQKVAAGEPRWDFYHSF